MPAEGRADGPVELGAERVIGDILDALVEGVAVFDRSGALAVGNAAFRALNPRIADLIVPDISWEVLVREAIQRGSIPESEGRLLRSMEASLLDARQPMPPLELHLSQGAVHEITLRNTSTGGFIVTQRDVTERKRQEMSDQQADVLLGKVLEACPANVVMSRIGDGQILYRSPAATELLGTSRCYYDHFASREDRADFITALLPDGRVDNIRTTGLRSDGTPFPCSISARVIEYHGEDVMVSNTVDISKEVALQRTLVEQREQIFQAEKMSALGELLAGVAHELNNPLSVVVGHALMMREEATEPSVLRRIGKISDAAERCARIVKSFLAMARQLPTELKPVDLAETIDTAVEALRLGASGLFSTVDVVLPADLPRVLCDADQIAQVFTNLISNADQAMESAGIGGRITIVARHDTASGMVEITVADDGPGIPKEIRSRIFDPLFTTKDVGKGTGIGLAFCHRVVTSHKGQIRLDPASRPGATTFVIRLPATDQRMAPDAETAAASEATRAARILVVDDEMDVADLIREVLERDGFHVDHAISAEAAFERLEKHAYALVLSDLNMPGIGGRGFYEKVVRDHPVLAERIGFVTGDTMSPSARGFLDGAQRPYLEKPIAPAELRALARRLLDDAVGNVGR